MPTEPDIQPDAPTAARYRFGLFEADVATGELRRQGVRIKLNAQPFQLLCLLLAHPNQVLTRNEIARKLWTSETFVDFDHGLNSAINRIREALGDTAANPRFVETLARRGYRFIAPVVALTSNSTLIAAEPTATLPRPSPEETVPDSAFATAFLATEEDLPPTPRRTVQTLFIGLQLMYVGYYVGALANLPEISDLFGEIISPPALASRVFVLLIVTATTLIPVRAFLTFAALFHAPGFRGRYLRLWPWLLPFDILWSLAPFLLLHHMSFGVALACTPLLVYSPFAQRSLVLMGAGLAPTSWVPRS
jgi:DNA-binding winged helix-turn-helix (wHTH) protein